MTTQIAHVQLQYSHTIGRQEFAGPGFRSPVDMARGRGDLMYVVNRSYEYRSEGKRITICTVGEDYVGEFARGVSVPGEWQVSGPDGSLIWPTSIAIDSGGNVYVADEWLNRISIFTSDGEWKGKWGTPGSGDGEISGPSGLSFDKDDNLYVVDSLNNRVEKFTRDGVFLSKWGKPGGGDGEFHMPWGIDIDSKGDVYVADWRNDRIQKFGSDGRFLMKLGTPGTGDGELSRPTDVAVDKEGIIYVIDWMNDRVQVFGADGSFITKLAGEATVSKWGKDKLDANQEMWKEREIAQGIEREKLFWGPIAIETDDDGRISVVESARGRIQVYRKQAPTFFGGRL